MWHIKSNNFLRAAGVKAKPQFFPAVANEGQFPRAACLCDKGIARKATGLKTTNVAEPLNFSDYYKHLFPDCTYRC